MASSLALKRLVSSSLLSRSLRPASSSSRLFNTSAACEYDSDDRDLDFDRRVFYPFSEVFGPSPVQARRNDVISKRNWYARESGEGLHLRVNMPGLGKEDVKVVVKHNTLVIQGEGKKETEEDDAGRRYSSRIHIPENLYKTNEIKGEMKNGVLNLFLPKIKEEERSDVFHVNVE